MAATATDVPFMGWPSFWRDGGAWKPLAWEHDADGVGFCVSLYPARMLTDTEPATDAGLFVEIEARDGAAQEPTTAVYLPLGREGPIRDADR